MRSVRRRRVLTGMAVLATFALAGCGAAPRPELPSAAPVSVAVSVPPDGVSLARLGFTNGPARAFSVPRDVVITTRIDQPTGVTVVFSSPTPRELADYLRRALPATGFVVTRDEPSASSMTFSGYGWQGSFTGTLASSAVTLHP